LLDSLLQESGGRGGEAVEPPAASTEGAAVAA